MIKSDKKPVVSIVIPCHNVDINFFSACIESVANQTLGIENMQVIVVLHNCTEESKKEVYDLLNKYKFIETYELINDAATPSSPRNYGVEKAKGRYIGFLDADDRYTENAIKDALDHNKKHDADMIIFRREYKLESEKAVPIKDKVLWDQLTDEIIIEDKTKSTEKIFTGLCGVVTSKIFKTSFLKENNLTFDEELIFAEDYLYIINAYTAAKKILLLPQLIGYCYFINSKSLVQSSEKTADVLLTYTKGYVKIFEAGLKNGYYMNCIIQRLCLTLARFMAKNDKLTYEQRVEIRDILKPYLDMTTIMTGSKAYSDKQIEETYMFPREVILHPEKWVDNKEDVLVLDELSKKEKIDPSLKILNEIISDNVGTNFADNYAFKDIMTAGGYMNKVPLLDYEFYKPLVELTTRVGETQIFTNHDIYAYIYTPGNTGETKLIPCTKKHIAPYVKEFSKIVKNHNTFLLMESSFIKHQYNDNAITNSLYGMILSSYFNDVSANLTSDSTIFSSPVELMFPDRAVDVTFERLYFALCDKNIDQIYAPYIWDVYIYINYLKKNWKFLCDAIEKGELPNTTKISDKLRNRLSYIVKPDKKRADELRKIFEEGFDENILKNIWPDLKRIVAVSIKTMRIYTRKLMKYSKGIEVVDGLYASAEALIGLPTDTVGINKLCIDSCFFEFKDEKSDKTILAKDLEINKKYEIVISNNAGLYRYRTYDVIEIVKLLDGEVYFKYAYNAKNAVSFLSNTMIYDVIYDTLKGYSVDFGDYSFGHVDKSLLVILEAENDVTEAEKLRKIDRKILADEIDKRLYVYDEYKKLKDTGKIDKVKVLIGEPETHLLYKDMVRKKSYYASDQIRPVRLLDTEEKIKYFNNFILEG